MTAIIEADKYGFLERGGGAWRFVGEETLQEKSLAHICVADTWLKTFNTQGGQYL